MAQVESRIPDIKANGAQLIYIAAEKQDGVWKPGRFLEKHPIAGPFLLDEERVVTNAYGLHHGLATDALNIAHPATLIIDRGGSVRYIYRGDNQRDRAPMNEVIAALQSLTN